MINHIFSKHVDTLIILFLISIIANFENYFIFSKMKSIFYFQQRLWVVLSIFLKV